MTISQVQKNFNSSQNFAVEVDGFFSFPPGYGSCPLHFVVEKTNKQKKTTTCGLTFIYLDSVIERNKNSLKHTVESRFSEH